MLHQDCEKRGVQLVTIFLWLSLSPQKDSHDDCVACDAEVLLTGNAEQKFSDLTNSVEMLETELIAMKLCKLKLEADKTEAELQVKQMEKTLHALQTGETSQVHPHSLYAATCLWLCCSAHVKSTMQPWSRHPQSPCIDDMCAGAGRAGGLRAGLQGSEWRGGGQHHQRT